MSNSKKITDLESALDDCIERNLFLERIVIKTSESLRPNDLAQLLDEVRRFMAAEHVALNFGGKWLEKVPRWLKKLHPPQKTHLSEIYLPTQVTATNLLLVPFNQGWAVFWGKENGFSLDDLSLVDSITEIISLAASSFKLRAEKMQAYLLEHERQLTAKIWRNIIPDKLPDINSYHVSSYWQPAKDFGGDFFFTADNWLILGDVSGKGMTAAFVASMFIPALRAATKHSSFLTNLDHALYQELNKVDMFATLVILKLNNNGEVLYYNLGHVPVFIKRNNGSIESLHPTTYPIGTFPILDDNAKTLKLNRGDIICLYSDGLLEAQREENQKIKIFGKDRIMQELNKGKTPEGILEGLKQNLQDWQIKDDLTVVIIEYNKG